jgi:hypothetical protein
MVHEDLVVDAASLFMFQHIFGIPEPTTAATILQKLSNEIPRFDMASRLQLVELLECVFFVFVGRAANFNRQAREERRSPTRVARPRRHKILRKRRKVHHH